MFEDIKKELTRYQLRANDGKSGVFPAFGRRFLGYDFLRHGNSILASQHKYQRKTRFREWHPCVVEKVNREYHIVKNGILNKKDYAFLFENGEEKHHIPVEVTEQINFYNEVVLSNSVIQTLCKERIRLGLFDRHGILMGYFIPDGYQKDAKVLLAQCSEYNEAAKRLAMARAIELAAIHNIRANLRYYDKHGKSLSEFVSLLSEGIKETNECKSVDDLLLIEARCRQVYYQSFNTILSNLDFQFTVRSRRPPKDPINALISFGNTILYNRFQQIIWKTALDSRIGVLHAANRRHFSLNLDFADLFKPIIVDRLIFSLINKGQITAYDFEKHKDDGVYFSERGKRLFLQAFEEKLASKLTVKEKSYTYLQLMEKEVYAYQKHLTEGEKYKPYKYY